MKKILVILLICITVVFFAVMHFSRDNQTASITELAAQLQPLTAPDAPSLSIISQDDLPPQGTASLFDHILADQETIPYPFEKMLAAVSSYGESNKPLSALLIPFSRSLLKAQANTAKPRLIAATDIEPKVQGNQLPYHFKGRLFLGLVEEADEIEVISYNEKAGRFEYQLVKDYRDGGTPKVVYAKRNICLTCHANQSTIFPVRPWQETNAQPNVAEQIRQAGAGDGKHYQGVNIDETLATAEDIDALTDIGNVVATAQRVWIDGCGTGDQNQQCRNVLLKLALQFAISPGDFNVDSELAKQLLAIQSQTWPSDGVALPDADIANRDPSKSDERGISAAKFKQLFKDDDELEDFDSLPKLPARLDPLTPRPHKAIWQANTLDGVFAVAQLFSQADIHLLEKAAGYKIGNVLAAVDSQAMQVHLQASVFQRGEIVPALIKEMSGEDISGCCDDVSAISAPVADGEPPIEISAGSVLNQFEQYCFACHRGNPSARLNFMSGKNEQIVLDKITETSEIADVLDYERYLNSSKASKLMPPANSKQRAALQDNINSGGQHLQQMREAVPSLFDF